MYVLMIVFAITAGHNAINVQQIPMKDLNACETAMTLMYKNKLPAYVSSSIHCIKTVK